MSEFETTAHGSRRRRWSSAEKRRIVEQTLEDGASIPAVARRNGVAVSLLYRWRRLMLDEGVLADIGEDGVASSRATLQMKDRVRELERQLGRKTLEVEILKEALNRSRSQNPR